MTNLSTAALVLHDLGVAAGFGGTLFGKMALSPAVRAIGSESERGKLMHEAWTGYRPVNAISLALMGGSWLVGRTMLSGREVSRDARVFTLVKDGLVIGAVLTGVASMITGEMLSRESAAGATPILTGSRPSPHAPARARTLQRIVNALGSVNMALTAGVIGVTAILAMKAGRSGKWSLLSRLLP